MHNLEQIRTGNRRLGEHKRFLSPKKYPHRNRRYLCMKQEQEFKKIKII